jgi:hypothetical protein
VLYVERGFSIDVDVEVTSAPRADVRMDEECFNLTGRTGARNAKIRSTSREE